MTADILRQRPLESNPSPQSSHSPITPSILLLCRRVCRARCRFLHRTRPNTARRTASTPALSKAIPKILLFGFRVSRCGRQGGLVLSFDELIELLSGAACAGLDALTCGKGGFLRLSGEV